MHANAREWNGCQIKTSEIPTLIRVDSRPLAVFHMDSYKISKPSTEGTQERRRPNGLHKDLLPRYYAFEDPRGPLERTIQSSVWKEDGYRPSLCEFA